ncbi:IS110 family transposase [bacterium CPR1]|nr:IS110 family transposase [bacterium CPR1]
MSLSSPNFRTPSIFVGLDVHKKTIAIAAIPGAGGAFVLEREVSATDLTALRKALTRLSATATVYCCYEASSAGFHLHRVLGQWGFNCQVIAPSMIPVLPGQRRKNDRLDARRLAEFYRSGLLTAVHIPTPEEEAVRDFVRMREATRRDLMRARNRALKFIRRKGIVYTAGGHWTVAHWAWLGKICLPIKIDQATLAEYLSRVDVLTAQVRELDRRIEELAKTEPYREQVRILCSFRGISTHTAMVLATELGDIRRFPNPRSLMCYLGLIPREHSSGERTRTGGITKSGNSHCRHVLVQASWSYRFRPSKGIGKTCRSPLAKRLEGAPPWLVEMSWKAQKRLWKRYNDLCLSRNSCIAVTAVSRELAGFIWAALWRSYNEPGHLNSGLPEAGFLPPETAALQAVG